MSELPTKDQILDWVRENPDAAGKREIARAFNIKGAARIDLKRLLRELEEEGHLTKRQKRLRPPGHIPPVTMLIGAGLDGDGDLLARPKDWDGEGDPPRIVHIPRKGEPALGVGDLFLGKLRPAEDEHGHFYEARLIKKIAKAARKMLGIYRRGPESGRLVPVDKRADKEWVIPHGEAGEAEDGELVEAEQLGGPRMGLPRGRVVERLGNAMAPRSISLIAMHEHQIPVEFSPEALAEADAAQEVGPEGREDLRDLPLVTIDPADARDHDDAVAAMPDDDPKNPGGWVVWVAIADVAAHVRPGTELDREARRRGNSAYFPDRVSPMLPEKLSADLCSLHEGEDRPCMAARLVLGEDGELRGHSFHRGMMNSRASLTYEQAQAAHEGTPDAQAEPLMETVIRPLFSAYAAAASARDRRQPLDLDLPERRIELDEEGNVAAIRLRDRFEAHRLIEEFMILANVAAAETLERRRQPLIYRVHEEPNPEKIEALREVVETVGLSFPKGQVTTTAQFNRLLRGARETESSELVSISVLRTQTQAYYSPDNYGHFGLHLKRYAHFTSPIRRYADLVVHRALIAALKLGDGGQTPEEAAGLADTAEHISLTERRAMEAERDTVDRYLAAYMSSRIGAEFPGRISGVTRFGIFVKLDETGADGLVPVSTLGREFFHYDADSQTLSGERSGTVLGLGMRVMVRLSEAVPVTGGLIFELLEVDGAGAMPGPARRRAGQSPRRKQAKGKIARAKAARKARRSR